MSELIFISYSLFTVAIVWSNVILYKKGVIILASVDEVLTAIDGLSETLATETTQIIALLEAAKTDPAKLQTALDKLAVHKANIEGMSEAVNPPA